MYKDNNLYLIGPPAAGKTSIGRELARVLGMEFYDSDLEIEKRAGADITWIFDIEGEDGFRSRERKVIEELTKMRGILLATGGGAIVDDQNRDRLSATGIVIYLSVSVEAQIARTEKDKKRPMLQGDIDKREVLTEILLERQHLYEQIADVTVNTDKRSVRSVVQEILEKIEE
jgi:shikimate kinase